MARPLKFKTVKELQKKIDEYFESCFRDIDKFDKDGKKTGALRIQERPFTISGLAMALDTTRETLLDYEDREEFSDTIKKAKLKCENFAEEQLFTSKNTAGVIFNLKNNYRRWADKQEIEHSGETTHNVNSNDLSKYSVEELKQLEQILSKDTESD